MMAFPSYDVDKLLHTSLYRVKQLYGWAQDVGELRSLEIAVGGAAMHDSKVSRYLHEVESRNIFTDGEALKQTMTEDNKRAAAEAVERMLQKRRQQSK